MEALDRAGDVAPAPRNQTCESESSSGTSSSGESPPGASSGDGAGPRVTVAWSHPFKLPGGAAYDVRSMYGHQHVGGRSVRFVNVTDPSSPITICDSIPRYGDKEGIAGDVAGFIVDIPGCRFDPPLRLRGGETYAIRSEYGADPRSHAPAGFSASGGHVARDPAVHDPGRSRRGGFFGVGGEDRRVRREARAGVRERGSLRRGGVERR